MRFALEVSEVVRAEWPDGRPVFFRVSAVDNLAGGWDLENTVPLARELKRLGIDVIDCSSGGVGGSNVLERARRYPGHQAAYAETVRREASIATVAGGLIMEPTHAEAILWYGQADLIAIGRQAMETPTSRCTRRASWGSRTNMRCCPCSTGSG